MGFISVVHKLAEECKSEERTIEIGGEDFSDKNFFWSFGPEHYEIPTIVFGFSYAILRV